MRPGGIPKSWRKRVGAVDSQGLTRKEPDNHLECVAVNVVVCEKKNEPCDSVVRRIYSGKSGDARVGLHIVRTRNRIEIAGEILEKTIASHGGIDLIHVSFDGFASLACCEYALRHDIPYVLSLSVGAGEKLFVADWEKRYFELFAKHSVLTIIPNAGLDKLLNLPVAFDNCNENHDVFLLEEIIRRAATFTCFKKPGFMDLLRCGDPKCLENLHDAIAQLGELNESLKLVSYGGQGMIYSMFSDRLKKTLAIKVPNYPKRSEARHPTMERTLLKEANLLERCNALGTRYIPLLHGNDVSGRFVAREFVEGRCLSELLKSSHDDSVSALQILSDYVDMTEELFYVFHELLGVVIKDYKPRNIILTETSHGREYKFVDLGSCLRESDIPFKSTDNSAKLGGGDFLHWAPEVLLSKFDRCDRKLDYFSFGVTCFRILTGEYPFSNSQSDSDLVRDTYAEEYRIAIGKLESTTAATRVDRALLRFIIDSMNPDCLKRTGKWFRPWIGSQIKTIEQLHTNTMEQLERNRLLESTRRKVAADKPAIILSSYCAWLVTQCQSQNIERLFFLSRDGYVLKKITEIFVHKLNLNVRCEYLYASRQSSRIVGIKAIDHAVLKWLMKKPKGETLTTGLLLKRLSLDNDSDVAMLLEKFGMTSETADAEKISALLEDERMQDLILSHVRREKRIAMRYLNDSGLTDDAFGRYALVDIGWQGRIPLSIKEMLGLRKLTVFYFGYLNPDDNVALDLRAWLFDNHVRADWFAFFDDTIATDFVEIMAAADHKTLLHYGELLESLPENVKDDDLAAWGVSEFHHAILAYAIALSAEDIKCLDCVADRELVVRKIKELTSSPSPAEATVFGEYPYCPEQTDSLKRPFRTKMAAIKRA